MQHLITTCSDNTSFRESITTLVLNQNLNRAFVLFELTPANEISLLDPCERTLGKCCNDPLRRPLLSAFDTTVCRFPIVVERVGATLLRFTTRRIVHAALGKPRHIVSPLLIQVIIQEDRWKQAELKRRARSEPLNNLPGGLKFLV